MQTGLNSVGGGGINVDGSTARSANTGAYDSGANKAIAVTRAKPEAMSLRLLPIGNSFHLASLFGGQGSRCRDDPGYATTSCTRPVCRTSATIRTRLAARSSNGLNALRRSRWRQRLEIYVTRVFVPVANPGDVRHISWPATYLGCTTRTLHRHGGKQHDHSNCQSSPIVVAQAQPGACRRRHHARGGRHRSRRRGLGGADDQADPGSNRRGQSRSSPAR